MKIYLSASTESILNSKELYRDILTVLTQFECENTNVYLNAVIANRESDHQDEDIYGNALKKIASSDLLIVDISEKSISLGVLIEFARNHNIPVLCICDEAFVHNIPRIIGLRKKSPIFALMVFTHFDLKKQLANFLQSFKKNKVKFNVFISAQIDAYMRWAAKSKKMNSKSDFFRYVIENHMKNDLDYVE